MQIVVLFDNYFIRLGFSMLEHALLLSFAVANLWWRVWMFLL
jgi:hypothetical protein